MDTRKGMGALASPIDLRNYRAVMATNTDIDFPDEFILEMPSVKDQGNVGSCVAHAIALIIEFHSRLQGDYYGPMSVGYIYGNRSGGYSGVGRHVSNALRDVLKYGTVPLEDFPENLEVPRAIELFKSRMVSLFPKSYPFRITRYYEVRDDKVMKTLLMQKQPLLFANDWYFSLDENNILRYDNNRADEGGHAVVICGWNKEGWVIQNSWGEDWGDHGRCILPYNYSKREVWAIEDTYSENAQKQEQEMYKSKVEELQQLLDEKIAEILRVNKQYDELQQTSTKQRDEIKRLESEVGSILADKERLDKECADLSSHIDRLKAEIETQKETAGENLEALQEALMVANSDLAILEDEREELLVVIRSLNKEAQAYQDTQKLLSELNEKYHKLNTEYQERSAEWEEALKKNEELENHIVEIKKPYSSGLGQILAKIMNAILNWFHQDIFEE